MNELQHGTQSLFFQQQGEIVSADFALNFAARPTRNMACAITGGCAKMTTADAIGLRNLERALCGQTRKAPKRKFAGFAIQGGTRMISTLDTTEVVPGITEIFPKVAQQCEGVELLGLVAGFRRFVRILDQPDLADKLILDKGDNVYTIVHPDCRSVLLLQPDPTNDEICDDEYKERARCFRRLHELGWPTLNIVYNGGSVTEREIKLWAYLGSKEREFWNMLLIKDSGRKCDQYANDEEFLRAHPNIHVAENDVDAISEKLFELQALVEVPDSKIIPFRRAG